MDSHRAGEDALRAGLRRQKKHGHQRHQAIRLMEAFAPGSGQNGGVYALRGAWLADIATLAEQNRLAGRQVHDAFAQYMDDLEASIRVVDLREWDSDLLSDDEMASQFPEVFAGMEQKRQRLAELSALFDAAEEDSEDSEAGALSRDRIVTLKAELKVANALARKAKREREKGDWLAHKAIAGEIEARLARHKALEDEFQQLKADLRAAEKQQDVLVEAACARLDSDEARRVIMKRLRGLLAQT